MDSSNETAIIRPRDPADIFKSPTPELIEAFIEQPFSATAEIITGLLANGTAGNSAAAGRVVQAIFKGRLFEQFALEIRELRKRGSIPDDWAENEQGAQTWVEVVAAIDSDVPDSERLDAMKAMFYAVNRVNAEDAERIAAYQLFQIAKKLTSGELLVLKANYEVYKEGELRGIGSNGFDEWARAICKRLGHQMISLIEHHEIALAENKLIRGPAHTPGRGIDPTDARMTDLGIRLCQNIETYHAIKKADTAESAGTVK